MYSAKSVGVIDRMRQRAERSAAEDGQPMSFDFLTIITTIIQLLPALQGLFASCKQQPPAPTPVPEALAAVGVSDETWQEANRSKFLAESSWTGDKFRPIAVGKGAREIAKNQGIKKKAAKPLSASSLQTSREESVEDLAIAFQSAKVNSGV